MLLLVAANLNRTKKRDKQNRFKNKWNRSILKARLESGSVQRQQALAFFSKTNVNPRHLKQRIASNIPRTPPHSRTIREWGSVSHPPCAGGQQRGKGERPLDLARTKTRKSNHDQLFWYKPTL